jgi:hypothetical protein
MKQNKTTTITVMAANILRKTLLISFFLVLAAMIFHSCKPALKVSTDYDRGVDFSSYKTFSMYDLKTKGNVNQLNRDRIVKYIKLEMIKKGFRETNNNPDLMINVVTILKDRRSYTANTNYYGYGGVYRPYRYWAVPVAGSTTVTTYDYKDGSIVIDIVDANTKKMIWEGVGNAEINKKPKDPDAAISEVVAKVMENFPMRTNADQSVSNLSNNLK